MSTPPPLPPDVRSRGTPWWIWVLGAAGAMAVVIALAMVVPQVQRDRERTERAYRAWAEAQAATDREEHEVALRHLERADANGLEHPDLEFARGWLLAVLERNEEAVAVYDAVMTPSHRETSDWQWYGHALYGVGRLEDARDAFTRSVGCKEPCVDAWAWHGYTSYELGDHETAVIAFDNALSMDAGMQRVQAWKGYALSSLGQDAKAEAALVRALELGDEDAPIYRWLVEIRVQGERYEEAGETVDAAAAAGVEEPWILVKRGWTQRCRGDLPAAETTLREAIATWPESHDAWLNLGIVLHEQDKLEEAEDKLRTALTLGDVHESAVLQLGRVLRDAGHMDEALVVLDRAVREYPDDFAAWYERGILHLRAKRYAKAIADLEASLERKPDHRETGEYLADAKAAQADR